MSNETAVATAGQMAPAVVEKVILNGDLSNLTAQERVAYHLQVCKHFGVDPVTKPFEYLSLDGKLVLYATRAFTDQVRDNRRISVRIISRETQGDVYVVTAQASTPDGRTDEATGVVSLVKEGGEWATSQSGKRYFKGSGEWNPIRGDALANALMKAETKAKRRATLSIVGCGWMDETELETVPQAQPVRVNHETGEVGTPVPQPTRTDDSDMELREWARAMGDGTEPDAADAMSAYDAMVKAGFDQPKGVMARLLEMYRGRPITKGEVVSKLMPGGISAAILAACRDHDDALLAALRRLEA